MVRMTRRDFISWFPLVRLRAGLATRARTCCLTASSSSAVASGRCAWSMSMTDCRSGWRSSFWLIPLADYERATPIPDSKMSRIRSRRTWSAVVLRWTAAAACSICLVALATRLPPRNVPAHRPATQPHAARVPAHLLEQPSRARRRRPGARAPRHIVDPPSGGRARARRGGPPGRRRLPLLHVLARRQHRGGVRRRGLPRPRLLARVRASLHRGDHDDRLRAPACVRRRSARRGALRAARGRRAARQPADGRDRLRARGGVAARAAAGRGSPAGEHPALPPRAFGHQARGRLARRAARGRRRGGWRAHAGRARAPCADRHGAAGRR